MRWSAVLATASLLIGSGRLLSQAAAGAQEPKARTLIRTEYYSGGERSVRLSEVMDTSEIKKRVVKTDQLFSVGPDLLFYQHMEIDNRDRSRRLFLATGRKEERIEFSRGLLESQLTPDEVRAGIGILRAGPDEFKILPENAKLKTVQLRVRTILDRWRPEARKALHEIAAAIPACNLALGSGDLFMILFPDIARGPGSSAPCAFQFKRADPDPIRDNRFLLLEPALTQLLKSPMSIAPERKVQE